VKSSLGRNFFEALMGGDGRSGIFTWREDRRKVRTTIVLVLAKSSHRRSMHLSVGVLNVCTISDSACLLLTKHWQLWRKLLQWAQSLRFPVLPRVSHEAVDIMQQLLCEREDRLGSQASSSVVRPNSMIVQARRSAFTTPSGA
jgi:protein-serine/threonine kinase